MPKGPKFEDEGQEHRRVLGDGQRYILYLLRA